MKLAKKWPEIGVKWPTPSFVLFVSKQSLQNPLLKLYFVNRSNAQLQKLEFSKDYFLHLLSINPLDVTLLENVSIDKSHYLSKNFVFPKLNYNAFQKISKSFILTFCVQTFYISNCLNRSSWS